MTFDELESPKTFLPGVKAKHVIVSSACRTGRGDDGARAEAVQRVSDELRVLLQAWDLDKGATFHLILTVDRQGRGDLHAPSEEGQ